MNTIYTFILLISEEISRQLIDSSAKVLFTVSALWKIAQEAVKLTKKQIPIIAINTEVCMYYFIFTTLVLIFYYSEVATSVN